MRKTCMVLEPDGVVKEWCCLSRLVPGKCAMVERNDCDIAHVPGDGWQYSSFSPSVIKSVANTALLALATAGQGA